LRRSDARADRQKPEAFDAAAFVGGELFEKAPMTSSNKMTIDALRRDED